MGNMSCTKRRGNPKIGIGQNFPFVFLGVSAAAMGGHLKWNSPSEVSEAVPISSLLENSLRTVCEKQKTYLG